MTQTSGKMKTILLAATTLAWGAGVCPASTLTWVGAGTSWNSTGNWDPSGIPTTTDEAVFTGNLGLTANKNIALDASQTVGTLTFNTATAFIIGTTAERASGYTLTLTNVNRNDVAGTEGIQTIAANVVLGNSSTWNIAGSNYLDVTGTISGAYAFTKTGAGTVRFAAANAYTGLTTILTGSIVGAAGNAVSGDLTVGAADGSSPAYYTSSANNSISTSKAITIYGNGTLRIAGGYQRVGSGGSLAIYGGTVSITNATGLQFNRGTGTGVFMTGGSISGQSIRSYGSGDDVNIRTYASTSTATVSSNGVVAAGRTMGFYVEDGAADIDLLYSGTISGSGSHLKKYGSGVLALSGTQTYTGTTLINGGIMTVLDAGVINSSTGIVLNGGELKYNSGTALTAPITFTSGRISGTGAIAAALTVGSGATLSPGNSIGTQAYTGGLTISGGAFDVELGRSGTTPVSDLADVTGAVTLDTGSDLKLTLYSGLTDPQVGDIFYLIRNDGTDAISGTFTKLNGTDTTLSEGSLFTWNSQQWQVTYGADYGNGFTGGNDMAITVVPEPAMLALLGLGGLALLRRRKNA